MMAIETKAWRVQFVRQNRSPNQLGFSQAASLIELGIPYVAVAHLIVSDKSPEEYWREMAVAKVIDKHGHAERLPNRKIDMMPATLMDRALGRLKKSCQQSELGLVSCYLDLGIKGAGGEALWYPSCRAASVNPKARIDALEAVAEFFYANASWFLDNPRYDPI